MDEQSRRRRRKDGFTVRTRQHDRVLDVVLEADEHGLLGQGDLLTLPGERRIVFISQSPIRNFGANIVEAYAENAGDIDTIVETASGGWAMSHMNAVNRSVLHAAAAELVYVGAGRFHAIPEWVSSAHRYSTERSVDFVIGILNRVADIRVRELVGGRELSESEEAGDQEAN